jgi:hypothetical protein
MTHFIHVMTISVHTMTIPFKVYICQL